MHLLSGKRGAILRLPLACVSGKNLATPTRQQSSMYRTPSILTTKTEASRFVVRILLSIHIRAAQEAGCVNYGILGQHMHGTQPPVEF